MEKNLATLLEDLVNSFELKNPLQIFLKVLHLSWKIWEEVSQVAKQIDIDWLSDIKTIKTYKYKICSDKIVFSEENNIEIEVDLKWVIISLIYDFLGKEEIEKFRKETKWLDFLSDEYFKKFAEMKKSDSFSYGLFSKYPNLFEQKNSEKIIFNYYKAEFDKINYKNGCFYYKEEKYELDKTYKDILTYPQYHQKIIKKLLETAWLKKLPKEFSFLKEKNPETKNILKLRIFQNKIKKHVKKEVKKIYTKFAIEELKYKIYSNFKQFKDYILKIYDSTILFLFRNLIIKKIAENTNSKLIKSKWYKLMKNMIIYWLSENNLEKHRLKEFFEILENKIKEINKKRYVPDIEILYLLAFIFIFEINFFFLKWIYTKEIIWVGLILLTLYVGYLIILNKKLLLKIWGWVFILSFFVLFSFKTNISTIAGSDISRNKKNKLIIIDRKDRQFIGATREISSNYYLWNAVNEIYQTYKKKFWLSLDLNHKQKLFNLVIEEYSKKSKINPNNIPDWYKINMQLLENIFLEKVKNL